MNYFQKCSCSSGGKVENFLDCAPCPPSVVSYSALKKIALSKLCPNEVCSIAKRCKMAETSAMKSDCAETLSAFACDLTCILIIVCVLCTVVIITIVIVAVIRRKKHLKQDTINAVFNDTNTDCSDKSSHIGANNVTMKRARDSEYPDGHQQSELPRTGDVDGALNETTKI